MGVDLVEVGRVDRLLKRYKERFLQRVFTTGERQYAARKAHTAEHLAGRFAAKEAFVKALGTGLRQGIVWTDVEVVREKGGRPSLQLHGRAKELAAKAGVVRMALSISHTSALAMAQVILETA
ncbi:MAG: holo-ACP synthase [Nitrospirae bacterium]|nr:holo-ACP synthase [Nitrospirota bacterium]